VESTLFPTLAYVGGPGEIAYFAQVSALFEEFSILPPAFVPRFSGTVIEPQVEKSVAGLGFSMEELAERREVLVDRVARREIPETVTGALRELRQRISSGFEPLLEGGGSIEAGLPGALGASRNRLLIELHRSEKKIVRALKRSDLASLQQLDRVLNALQPHGEPQDRVLNILPFLARYRSHFVREIERAIANGWRFPDSP
jgi:bacillithiol synthase